MSDPEFLPEEEVVAAAEQEDGLERRKLRRRQKRPPGWTGGRGTKKKQSEEELTAERDRLRELRGKTALDTHAHLVILHCLASLKLEEARKEKAALEKALKAASTSVQDGEPPKKRGRPSKASAKADPQQEPCALCHRPNPVTCVFCNKVQPIKKRRGRPPKAKPARVQERAAFLLGFGKATVSRVLAHWNQVKREHQGLPTALTITKNQGKGGKHVRRIPPTQVVKNMCRDYVMKCRLNQERVTATQVLHMLRDKGILSVKQDLLGGDDPKDYKAAVRALQRYLVDNGFERGRKAAPKNTDQQRNQLAHFLVELIKNRLLPPDKRLREVSTDESYIDHNHNHDSQSLRHRDDKGTPAIRKGRRRCIIAAIQGPDPRAEGLDSPAPHQLAGVVSNSLWDFDPSAGKRKEERDIKKMRKELEEFRQKERMVQAGQQAAPSQAGQCSAQSSVTTATATATTTATAATIAELASAASSSSTAPAKSPEAQDASPLEYTV